MIDKKKFMDQNNTVFYLPIRTIQRSIIMILCCIVFMFCTTVNHVYEPYERVIYETSRGDFDHGYFYNYYKKHAIIVSDTIWNDNTSIGKIKHDKIITESKKKRIN